MFSLGANELIIIVFVAILIIAPKDVPVVMKSLGKILARIRIFSRGVNHHLNDFIDNAIINQEVEDDE